MSVKSGRNEGHLAFFGSHAETVLRLQFAAGAVSRLARYRDTLHRVEKLPSARKLLAERAREAENDGRIVLKCALDSLNQLRDSGTIEKEKEETAKLVDASRRLDVTKAIGDARGILRENLADMDLTFLDEAEKVLRDSEAEVFLREDTLDCRVQLQDGYAQSFSLALKTRPGDLGRVGSSEFFGQEGASLTLGDPAFADEDSHHGKQKIDIKPQILDSYAHSIGALAYVRDTMARQTQVAEYFGQAHVRGELVALIVIAIIGAIVLIAGIAIKVACDSGAWHAGVCQYAMVIVFAGIALLGIGLSGGTATIVLVGGTMAA